MKDGHKPASPHVTCVTDNRRDSFRFERAHAPRAANTVLDKFGRPMPPRVPYAIASGRS
ncbi:hypothetical protein [Aurantiacibacter luteus]|uniref:hypothetical protein n=1 Tax=Aurantiacibacter luteus TaxID=1581420 RepID=UPI000B2BF290|nr:hypothetical protein [Aurantiacibacter luteus]